MDDQGKFYLTGSVSDGFSNYLTWDGAGGLTVAGNINIVGANSNIYTQTEINTISASISASAWGAFQSASSYSSSLSTTITTNSGSTLTSISASNAASLAYSASTAATTALLDGRIFTDANGRVVKAPTASVAGLFLGNTHLGFYDSGTWKTYMDNAGKFYLTGSVANGYSNYLVWDGAGGLTIAGSINITGGNGATQTYASGQKDLAIASGSSAISSLSGSIKTRTDGLGSDITTIDDKVFTNALGRITKVPTSGSTAGLYLGSTNLGYYNGTSWRTYMDNTGLFYLTGSGGGNALLWNGNTLIVKGTITVGNTDLTEANTLNSNNTSSSIGLGNVSNLTPQNQAQTGLISGTTITGGGITLDGGGNIKGGQTNYNTGTGFFLGYHGSAYKFSIGNASTKGITWDGNALSIGGDVTIGTTLASTVVSNAAAVSGKISTGDAASDVNSGVTKISGGQIVADSITATQISGLNFTGKTATFNQGTIGGWELGATRLKSTDSVTRLDSTNKEFAVMDPNNLNVYKVRIGAGTTFQAQTFKPFTEINESGIQMGGIVDTNGNVLSISLSGYNDTANSNTGVHLAAYSSINYTTNQYVPIYGRIITNNSGVSSGVAAGEFVGGIIATNTTTPGASDAINQGFAIITDGHNYLGGAGKTTQITNQLYLSGLVLNPSSPGVNSFIKVVDSTGYAFRSSSSRKTKNIYGNWKIDGVLENIKKVPVERFKYKKWADNEVETFGLIAEDLHNNEFWQAVTYDADKDGRAIYEEETVSGIDYEKVTSILWKGMQELLQKVEDLETQLKNK